MNIITNESLIKRNARIGQVAMLAGLGVLGGGMYLSWKNPELFSLSIGALIVGFLLSQIGIYYSNRWGRRPRPDEVLDKSLKGLDNKYTIYHYSSPASHLLLGPAGVWVLIPRHQGGTITYSNGRYRQKGGNLYLKIFAQEGLGKPETEIFAEQDAVAKFLQKHLPEDKLPDIRSALLFTNPKSIVEVSSEENPPAETIPLNKLKDMIRKEAKSKHLSQEKVKELESVLGE
jgi:hypothetical protein